MKTRLAAALVALGLPSCQQDRDQAGAPAAETSGDAGAQSVGTQAADYPLEVWGDLPVSEAWDSAAIRIVENASPEEGSRLHGVIGPEPDVTIGDSDGEDPYLLSHARDATKLSDGRIVVADGSTSELRVFDATGAYLATWGGQGEGPGEFPWMSLGAVEPWPGDSIVAWYSDAQTISVFDSEGNFGRSFNRAGAGQRPWEVARPELVRRDGSILAVLEQGENAGTAEVLILNGEGGLNKSLGHHASRRALYFSRELKLGLWGDLVVVSTNHKYELKAFAADGTRGDACGAGDLRDRGGLRAGARQGRTRCGDDPGVAVEAVGVKAPESQGSRLGGRFRDRTPRPVPLRVGLIVNCDLHFVKCS